MKNETKMTAAELEYELSNFYGSETFTRYMGGILLTEGVKFLAEEAGAFWLLDIVWSISATVRKVQAEDFVTIKLVKNTKGGALFTADDGNGNILYKQKIEYTNFPLPEITMFFTNKVLMLPSEY